MNKQLEMEKFIPKMSPEEFGQFVKEQFAITRPVIYYKRMVDGVGSDPVSTKITSPPWQLGHGEWVCKVDGVAGGVALSHLRFVEDTQGDIEEEAEPDWKDAPPWAQYRTVDDDGMVVYWKTEPYANKEDGTWTHRDARAEFKEIKYHYLDWEKSLQKRPC